MPVTPVVAGAANWAEAETILRVPLSGDSWWSHEERERKRLMIEAARRAGQEMLLDTLTTAVDGDAGATYRDALASGADEALAKVASGAAMSAIHLRALALLAGCGPAHVFMQKYALFEAGRFPLGMRDSRFLIF